MKQRKSLQYIQRVLKSQIFPRNKLMKMDLITNLPLPGHRPGPMRSFLPHGKFVSRDDLGLLTIRINSKTDPLLNGRNVPFSSNPYFTFKYFKFNSNSIKSQTRVS